ncbi:MAG: molybdopterin-dependent oxidoreductase [Psychrobium sp.]|nr:molybdopterin-dependent oxidoreductase [Psychrobium sp.]
MAENKTVNVKSTCPYCGVGCGVDVKINGDKVSVMGDKNHPANFGKLCIKGKNLGDTLDNNNRLLSPVVQGRAQSWPRALDYVASKLNQTIAQYGKDSVAFYVSGQLLTEDYYVANKLMKGFIGSGNIDTNSRLCMSSAVVAHKRAFGEDIVPLSYSDITNSDLIVLAGSNLAWCHPVIYQRIREEKERRPELKIVVIDPRVTASVELADLHLAVKAGSDLILFNGLLDYLSKNSQLDDSFADFDKVLDYAAQDAQRLAEVGVPLADIDKFYQLFNNSDKVVTMFSQGINQSVQGSDQGSAILNCHLASGKIGKMGCGPFSITGQPNAMGGREVGALANTLASHIEFSDDDLLEPLAQFWQTDNLATSGGLKAVDLFDAIDEGKIKAIWIMATNPVVSLPDHAKITRALKKCPLVIVSDCVAKNDTLDFADVILPAQGWGEKSGTVTNSERRISRQRAFLPSYGAAKADWWIVSEVGKRMGFVDAFSYDNPAQIFAEHARLSGLNNDGSRAFDISAFGDITLGQYDNLRPTQWPQAKGQARMVSDQLMFSDSKYFHDDKQAKLYACMTPKSTKKQAVTDNEFTLNTGRNRDQWHTQTRTGKSATLTNRHPEPQVEMHPTDAAAHKIRDNTLIKLTSARGSLLARVKVNLLQRRGDLFMPIHWSNSSSNQGCVSQLIEPEFDPDSGQPAFKHSKVSVKANHFQSEAMLLVSGELALDICPYQVSQPIAGGYCYHLASDESPPQLFERLSQLLDTHLDNSSALASLNASDPKQLYFRKSFLDNGEMVAGISVAARKQDLPEGWISQFFTDNEANKRQFISADVVSVQQQKTFCQCLNIPMSEIKTAMASGQLTVADIRKKTGAGNGCGSCIGDISLALAQKKLLENTATMEN